MLIWVDKQCMDQVLTWYDTLLHRCLWISSKSQSVIVKDMASVKTLDYRKCCVHYMYSGWNKMLLSRGIKKPLPCHWVFVLPSMVVNNLNGCYRNALGLARGSLRLRYLTVNQTPVICKRSVAFIHYTTDCLDGADRRAPPRLNFLDFMKFLRNSVGAQPPPPFTNHNIRDFLGVFLWKSAKLYVSAPFPWWVAAPGSFLLGGGGNQG